MNVRLLAFGFLLSLFSSFGQTFFIALSGAQIREGFGLSHGGFGSVYSLATLASGVSMIWVGAALDWMSMRAYAAAATAGLAGACALLAVADSIHLLALALFGLRLCGQGMMSHASITGMARAFVHNRGKAVAIATLGHPAGEAVLPLLAVIAIAALGWRSVWLAAASLLLVALAVILRLLVRAGETAEAAHPLHAGASLVTSLTRKEMLRDARFHLILPALLGPSFIITGLFFHQVHLVEAKGWALSWFASCFAAYALASTAGTMLAGTLVDRLGAVRLMPLYLLPLCLACVILAQGDRDLVALAFMISAGITMGASNTVLTAMWAEVYGTGHLGAIRALAASITVVSSALAPASMGWLIDRGVAMDAMALGCAGYLALANLLVLMAFLRGPTSSRA
jgi:MFS family permease